MRKRKLRIRECYLLFAVTATSLIFSFFFVFSSLRASILIKRSIQAGLRPQELESLMPYYFKDILLSFSEAIQINRENAELYEKKIDYLEAALDRGLEKELGIDIKKDIEEAYIKAIKFNPTNYYYHLGLGWFYTEENRFKEAEKELMKSQSLYPIEFNVYFYLAKYYLKLGRKEGVVGVEEEIFKTLLRAINIIKYGRERNMWAQMKRMIKEVPTISWDERKGELKYIAELGADRFDFKQRKFPHDKIPLTIRLYIKDPVQEVALYKRDIRFQSFRKIKITPEYNVYEVKLDYFPNDTYLDDLRIETNPAIIINKIEIVKSFK